MPLAVDLFNDPKGLIDVLLRKYGRFVSESADDQGILPHATYELPKSPDYRLDGGMASADISFGGKVSLRGVAYGRTALNLDETPDALLSKRVPSGNQIWAALRWQAETPFEPTLKTSLYLMDQSGHVAGQIDALLLSDLAPFQRYGLLRSWGQGESGTTYHILPTLPAIASGHYGLYLKVYDGETLQSYPVLDSTGAVEAPSALVGYVDITRPIATPVVRPGNLLPADTLLAPDLSLLGYDLSSSSVSPGGLLGLTYYWQARAELRRDYVIGTELRDAGGTAVAGREARPANGTYPTTEWQAGDVVRDWQDLSVPPTLPAGMYELVVTASDGQGRLGELSLGQVDVSGRPRSFEPPALTHPFAASFGENVVLLGVNAPAMIEVAPGQPFTLTLAWQPQATPRQDLVRFVHLIGADGRPVAQDDMRPCNGACPAQSWLPGEVLVEEVQLTVPASLASGDYSVAVGWYDAVDYQRLPAFVTGGQRAPGDLVILPVRVRVTAERR
jgi:hypothetical protein